MKLIPLLHSWQWLRLRLWRHGALQPACDTDCTQNTDIRSNKNSWSHRHHTRSAFQRTWKVLIAVLICKLRLLFANKTEVTVVCAMSPIVPFEFNVTNDGYWGDTTSTLDWCEGNYEVSWQQPSHWQAWESLTKIYANYKMTQQMMVHSYRRPVSSSFKLTWRKLCIMWEYLNRSLIPLNHGSQTARSICYREITATNYVSIPQTLCQVSWYIAEFYNTLTNLAMIAPACYGIHKVRTHNLERRWVMERGHRIK